MSNEWKMCEKESRYDPALYLKVSLDGVAGEEQAFYENHVTIGPNEDDDIQIPAEVATSLKQSWLMFFPGDCGVNLSRFYPKTGDDYLLVVGAKGEVKLSDRLTILFHHRRA